MLLFVSDVVTARRMTDEDDLAAVNAGNPMAWQAVWWQELSATMDVQWFTGLVDGVPAGFAAVCPLPVAAGGNGAAIVHVLPRYRRRGLGRVLRDAVEDVARGQRPGITYSYAEGEADGEAAARAWGLPVVGRHHESVLDLGAIDRSLYGDKAIASGVEISELPLGTMDDAAWRSIHEFVQARLREAPDSADGGGDLPCESFRDMVDEPWMLLTARDGAELVGVTQVMRRPGDPSAMNTFFTGVLAAARGRGIATALKTRQALLMADRGVARVFTQNMEGNQAILAANRTLGFVRASGYVDVSQDLP
jgi:GNAT superfamily N-acetyltransferase